MTLNDALIAHLRDPRSPLYYSYPGLRHFYFVGIHNYRTYQNTAEVGEAPHGGKSAILDIQPLCIDAEADLYHPLYAALHNHPRFHTATITSSWKSSDAPTFPYRWSGAATLGEILEFSTFAVATAILELLPFDTPIQPRITRLEDSKPMRHHGRTRSEFYAVSVNHALVTADAGPDAGGENRRRACMIIMLQPALSRDMMAFIRSASGHMRPTGTDSRREDGRYAVLQQLAYRMRQTNAPIGAIYNGGDLIVFQRDFDHDLKQLQRLAAPAETPPSLCTQHSAPDTASPSSSNSSSSAPTASKRRRVAVDSPGAQHTSPLPRSSAEVRTLAVGSQGNSDYPPEPASNHAELGAIRLFSWSTSFCHPGEPHDPSHDDIPNFREDNPSTCLAALCLSSYRALQARDSRLDDSNAARIKRQFFLRGGKCVCLAGQAISTVASPDDRGDDENEGPVARGNYIRRWMQKKRLLEKIIQDMGSSDAAHTPSSSPPWSYYDALETLEPVRPSMGSLCTGGEEQTRPTLFAFGRLPSSPCLDKPHPEARGADPVYIILGKRNRPVHHGRLTSAYHAVMYLFLDNDGRVQLRASSKLLEDAVRAAFAVDPDGDSNSTASSATSMPRSNRLYMLHSTLSFDDAGCPAPAQLLSLLSQWESTSIAIRASYEIIFKLPNSRPFETEGEAPGTPTASSTLNKTATATLESEDGDKANSLASSRDSGHYSAFQSDESDLDDDPWTWGCPQGLCDVLLQSDQPVSRRSDNISPEENHGRAAATIAARQADHAKNVLEAFEREGEALKVLAQGTQADSDLIAPEGRLYLALATREHVIREQETSTNTSSPMLSLLEVPVPVLRDVGVTLSQFFGFLRNRSGAPFVQDAHTTCEKLLAHMNATAASTVAHSDEIPSSKLCRSSTDVDAVVKPLREQAHVQLSALHTHGIAHRNLSPSSVCTSFPVPEASEANDAVRIDRHAISTTAQVIKPHVSIIGLGCSVSKTSGAAHEVRKGKRRHHHPYPTPGAESASHDDDGNDDGNGANQGKVGDETWWLCQKQNDIQDLDLVFDSLVTAFEHFLCMART